MGYEVWVLILGFSEELMFFDMIFFAFFFFDVSQTGKDQMNKERQIGYKVPHMNKEWFLFGKCFIISP